ncbi:hypothetical protein BST81_06420 [Leptolyngbya sp. 'hensonii']|nr:hypothetical protein BST81_06420 [Leptolyngbya sp. 'hensonii']
MTGLTHGGFLALSILALAAPVLAQSSNFGTMTLAPGFSASAGTASGYTGGSVSLASIANQDRDGNLCLGYGGDREMPDHVIVLQQDFSQLTVEFKDKRQPLTLLIQGPGGVRCGEGRVTGPGWSSGTYRLWVGTPDPGRRSNYTLFVRQ